MIVPIYAYTIYPIHHEYIQSHCYLHHEYIQSHCYLDLRFSIAILYYTVSYPDQSMRDLGMRLVLHFKQVHRTTMYTEQYKWRNCHS